MICCFFLMSCDKEEVFEMSSPEDLIFYRSINSDLANTDGVLMKDSLRILDIGNSYTTDATAMLPMVFESLGIDAKDICYYALVRASGSFKNWNDCYHDADDCDYYYHKIVGGLSSAVKEGKYNAYNGAGLRGVLSEKWDLIIIHQYSRYAVNYDNWLMLSNQGYLPQFTALIHSLQPNATLGTYIIHSYANDYKYNTEGTSFDRWKNISKAVQRMTEDAPAFQVVIPYGTAIQNLRSCYGDANRMDMTRDGTHLGYGLARLTASACLFQTLFSKRYGVTINDCHLHYECTEEERNESPKGCTDVTADNLPYAISSAIAAYEHPYGYWY